MYDPGMWGLILAGGEGVRLRGLTRLVSGDERPKQFVELFGHETLLDRTRRRAALLIDPARMCVSLMRAHERYWAALLDDVPPHGLVVQPARRGTAPAILYGLLRVAHAAPMATVVVLPSDHWISDESAFMRHVERACAAVRRRRDIVVLLGMAPDRPEVEYGWIEPGETIGRGPLRRIRDFVEKPDAAAAKSLYDAGCLWNSFVMVGAVPTFLALIRLTAPSLWAAFAPVRRVVGSARESQVVERVYAGLRPTDFSGVVLSRAGANLATLRVDGVAWNDLGRPERVLATLRQLRIAPVWTAAGALTHVR